MFAMVAFHLIFLILQYCLLFYESIYFHFLTFFHGALQKAELCK